MKSLSINSTQKYKLVPVPEKKNWPILFFSFSVNVFLEGCLVFPVGTWSKCQHILSNMMVKYRKILTWPGITRSTVNKDPGCLAPSLKLHILLCTTFPVLCGILYLLCGISSLKGPSKNSWGFFFPPCRYSTVVTEQPWLYMIILCYLSWRGTAQCRLKALIEPLIENHTPLTNALHDCDMKYKHPQPHVKQKTLMYCMFGTSFLLKVNPWKPKLLKTSRRWMKMKWGSRCEQKKVDENTDIVKKTKTLAHRKQNNTCGSWAHMMWHWNHRDNWFKDSNSGSMEEPDCLEVKNDRGELNFVKYQE